MRIALIISCVLLFMGAGCEEQKLSKKITDRYIKDGFQQAAYRLDALEARQQKLEECYFKLRDKSCQELAEEIGL